VLVGSSNPHQFYVFNNVEFPTEVSIEAFSPDYLASSNHGRRPKIASRSPIDEQVCLKYGENLMLLFRAQQLDPVVSVTLVAPSFTTHTFAQGQRLLFLETQVSRPDGFLVSGGTKSPLPPGVLWCRSLHCTKIQG
jgi:hypothetical protein